jgi:hypothetical protein
VAKRQKVSAYMAETANERTPSLLDQADPVSTDCCFVCTMIFLLLKNFFLSNLSVPFKSLTLFVIFFGLLCKLGQPLVRPAQGIEASASASFLCLSLLC